MKFTGLIINGTHYSNQELIGLAKKGDQLPKEKQWLQPLYRFIGQWLDDSPTVRLQTSGSTGEPKIIIAPKKALIASAQATASFFRFKKGDTILLCLPADFIAGKMIIVRAFISGLNLFAIPPSTDALHLLGQAEIKLAPLVPIQLERLFDGSYPKSDIAGILNRIENILVGGTALNSSLYNYLACSAPPCDCACYVSYGMTETYSHIGLQKIDGKVKEKLFTAMDGVSFAVDHEARLIISAPHLGIDRLVTNDIARLHSATHFELLGRADNVINSGGLKIFPERVEEKLGQILQNCRYFIHGTADPVLGQIVTLFIESAADKSIESAALPQKIRAVVGEYENPRKIVHLERFYLTSSGKIQRRKTVESADCK